MDGTDSITTLLRLLLTMVYQRILKVERLKCRNTPTECVTQTRPGTVSSCVVLPGTRSRSGKRKRQNDGIDSFQIRRRRGRVSNPVGCFRGLSTHSGST